MLKEEILPYKISLFFIVFIISLSANAQLCEGSLGDPVVNINFGSGSNPGPSLPASTTNYGYVNYDCPSDGQYTIINATSGCFQNTWFTLPSDHTGNSNGYFMLVNASFQPSDFYVDTVHGLCPNTTFEFAAWIMNILVPFACNGNGIPPKITFNIETTSGQILNTFSTDAIPSTASAQWKQYGLYFKTALNESDVVIRMRNDTVGGCGNDLALDDITFRPCGPIINTSIVNNTASDTINVCESKNYTYTFKSTVSSGYANPTFQWQENEGSGWVDVANANEMSLTENFTKAGNYQFRLEVADEGDIGITSCRIASNIIQININPIPKIIITPNGGSCLGKSFALNVSGGARYIWSGPNSFSSIDSNINFPALSLNDEGKYLVTSTNQFECSSTDSFLLNVHQLPTAFAGNDTTICNGQSINLKATGGIKYFWQPASFLSSDSIANPIATPTDTTQYLLTVTDQNNCSDSASITINVNQPPIVSGDHEKIIMEGQSAQIHATATGTNITYQWTPDVFINDPFSLMPVVNPPSDTTYTLTAVSNAGCGEAFLKVFIRVYEKLIIPNAFSPNGDGINDTWKIGKIETYPGAEILIFNRYGQTVFQSENFAQWNGMLNGKPLPEGTYYYLIDLKNSLPKLSGWIEIVR